MKTTTEFGAIVHRFGDVLLEQKENGEFHFLKATDDGVEEKEKQFYKKYGFHLEFQQKHFDERLVLTQNGTVLRENFIATLKKGEDCHAEGLCLRWISTDRFYDIEWDEVDKETAYLIRE